MLALFLLTGTDIICPTASCFYKKIFFGIFLGILAFKCFCKMLQQLALIVIEQIKTQVYLINQIYLCFGVPGGIRTPDLLVRSQTLYPAELQAHLISQIIITHIM